MAITKILARKGGLREAIRYVMNGDKTEEQLLVATQLCTKDHAYHEMMHTKERHRKPGGVQYYHMIQSFQPGEITPDLAMEIARTFVAEHLPDYEAVIGVHTDRGHIHAHILFNSVSWTDGQKYHSNAWTYYTQIRAISDRLCREHGLSVIMNSTDEKAMSYLEWLRTQRGQPTYRSMLKADMERAIEDANTIGEFYQQMERMGYEIKFGNRISFRYAGQERYICPERKDIHYSEEGIRNAIAGNLEAIALGQKPVYIPRPRYRPYKKHPKYTGFLALYVHYLYLLGKIQKQEYPPKMTPYLRGEVMKFEAYKAQFQFLREHDIITEMELKLYLSQLGDNEKALTKERTILNVQKKRKQNLFFALTTVERLAPAKALYDTGNTDFEADAEQYLAAEKVLHESGISREEISRQQRELYDKLADLNREIRRIRKEENLCKEILEDAPQMEKTIAEAELQPDRKEMREHEQLRQ